MMPLSPNTHRRAIALFATITGASAASVASGGWVELIEFPDHDDYTEWVAAVGGPGAFTTMDFTGLGEGFITDEYLDLGALFLEGDDFIWENGAFLDDGWGVAAFDKDQIFVQFCKPQRYVAIDFPGSARIGLSYQGDWFALSSWFCCGPDSFDQFGGLISPVPFDLIAIWDLDTVAVDNIHFGRFPPVAGDATFDDVVDVDDLISVITSWGECTVPPDACPVPPCAHADLNDDGAVDVNDLIEVLISWTIG